MADTSLSPVRVLHFLGSGELGGQERAIFQVARGFVGDPDFAVGVAFGRSSGPFYDRIVDLGIPVIDTRIGSGYSLRFRPSVIERISEFDIHHLHDPSPNTILLSALAGKEIIRVFTRRGGVRSMDEWGTKKKAKYVMKRALLRRYMDGFSGNTANAAQSVVEQYHANGHPVSVLYNGLDFGLMSPTVEPDEVRARYGLSRQHFVVGVACRLVDWKRTDLLMRAFSKARIENGRLLVLGDGEERSNLESLAGTLGIADRVIFAGMVPDIFDHYRIMDCFVLASTRDESFGNAVPEAMYQRVPSIVMADSDGLLEHVEHEQTGFVAKDEGHLAELLEYVERHPEEARQVAERGSKYVVEKYSLERMLQRYKEFYESVLSQRRTA